MGKQITKQQANRILESRFLGKYVKFTYPGKQPVCGRCDSIGLGDGVRDANLVLIKMGDKMYRVSPECLNECLELIQKTNGDTHGGKDDDAAGSHEDH